MTPTGTVTFRIFRFDPEQDLEPRFQDFSVPVRKGSTVLEGLYYIQQNLDGSLAFRSSCRSGVCGSCGMHIAGRYRLACETQVLRLGTDMVVIRPLGHLKVLRDLVVDMTPFWDKYKRIRPYLIPGEPPPERERTQSPDDRAKLDGLIDCILCGLCSSACAMGGADEDYLGPAALLQAHRFVSDSRDGATEERLRLVDGDHGVWRCHTIFSCQKVCPKDLDPAGSIARLKREILRHRLRRLVR